MLKFCKDGKGTRNESISYRDLEDKSFQSIIRRTRPANRLLECLHSPMRLGRGSPPPKPSEAQPVAESAEKQAFQAFSYPQMLQTSSNIYFNLEVLCAEKCTRFLFVRVQVDFE
jgi:hypothetical protein